MNPALEDAYFCAYTPEHKTAFGYIWKRADFPWIGIWEENHSRSHAPWRGRTLTRGMEFGASPFPETRRRMTDRGGLFGEQGYRWIPARGKATVEYAIFIAESPGAPETIERTAGSISAPGWFELASEP
jgi:hypothetical protein